MRAWDPSRTEARNWTLAEQDGYALLDVEGAVKRYRLRELLELENVHMVSFTAMMWAHRLALEDAWRILDTSNLFRMVCFWLEREFEEVGRRVRVVYEDIRVQLGGDLSNF